MRAFVVVGLTPRRAPAARALSTVAQRQLRRIIGYQQLAKLAAAIERVLAPAPTELAARLVTV